MFGQQFGGMQAPKANKPITHTTSPIVTGASVLAIKYKGGVMMMADTLASYGGLARYTEAKRMISVNKSTLIGASGEYSDFQFIQKFLGDMVTEDYVEDDGSELNAREVHSVLARIMYNRRSKMDPLWNQLVVAGVKEEGETFLGLVDLYGTSYTENMLATGYGGHLAVPIMRNEWKEDMSEADAKLLLEKCMRVCFYRDCRTINKFQLSTITADKTVISAPYSLDTEWSFRRMVNPHETKIGPIGA